MIIQLLVEFHNFLFICFYLLSLFCSKILPRDAITFTHHVCLGLLDSAGFSDFPCFLAAWRRTCQVFCRRTSFGLFSFSLLWLVQGYGFLRGRLQSLSTIFITLWQHCQHNGSFDLDPDNLSEIAFVIGFLWCKVTLFIPSFHLVLFERILSSPYLRVREPYYISPWQ